MTKRTKKPKTESNASGLLPLEISSIEGAQDFDSDGMIALCSHAQTIGKQAVSALSQLVKTCEEIQREGIPNAFTNSDLSPRLKQLIEQSQQVIPKVPTLLVELATLTDDWRANEGRTRRSRFEEIAKQLNWKVIGSWPEPVIEQVVFVVVNDSNSQATINGQKIKGTATAERIASAIAHELETLRKDRTEPVEFISSMRKAFARIGESAVKGVAVHDVLREIVWQRQSKAFQKDPRPELFKGYSVSQFRSDLTYYLASGAPPVKDGNTEYKLEIHGGSFASDGIFMYFPETDRLATCGRLKFRSVDGEER